MKMKKLVAGLLSAAMVFTSVSYNGYGVNEVEAATTAETTTDDVMQIKNAVEIASSILVKNASANSAQGERSNADGPAKWAFDDDMNHWWHSKYNDTGTGVDGRASAENPITIQTGFDKAEKICKVKYTARGQNTNVIKDYELQYANVTTGEPSDSDWKVLTSGTLQNVVEQDITFTTTEATHIRFKITSVYNSGSSHVCAKKIRVYKEEATDYNVNNYQKFWEYERISGGLGIQTDADRWHFELKPKSGTWKNRVAGEEGIGFDANGNSGSVVEKYRGEWRRNDDWSDKIWFCGFRDIRSQFYASSAISWNAPRAGYYKFKQVGNAGHSGLNGTDKKMELRVVKANETKQDGTLVYTLNNGNAFVTEAQKLAQNDKFRLMTVCTSGSFDYYGTLSNANSLTWEVEDCTRATLTAYANSAKTEIDNSGKPEAEKAKATAKLNELNKLLAGTDATNDQLIAAEDEVKKAIEDLKAFVEKFTVTLTGATTTDATTDIVSGATVTATADKALAGQKFSHWTVNGQKVGGQATHTFTITADTTIKAVYVVEFPLTCDVQYDETQKIASFIATRRVPAGVTVLKHGIIMTDKTGYNAYQDKFSMGSKRKIVRTAKSTTNVGRYGIRLSKVTGTWYARGYVEYQLSDGTTGYYYSPITQVTFQ